MKIILVFLVVSSSVFAGTKNQKSIHPKKMQYNLYELYSKFFINETEEMVSVKGVRYRRGRFSRAANQFKVPLDVFNRSKRLAKHVLKVTQEDSFSGTSNHGSAVYLGNNLVLTNMHVVSPGMYARTSCYSIKFSTNAFSDRKSTRFGCKKILHCSKTKDFCLLESYPDRKRLMKTLPKLELQLNPSLGEDELITAIGNPQGYGIHASSGYGLKRSDMKILERVFYVGLMFYAPVFEGNSGGAIFAESDKLVGLVRSRSKEVNSVKAFSKAVRLDKIKEELEEELKDKSILDKINFVD